jgi:hypothetical protein
MNLLNQTYHIKSTGIGLYFKIFLLKNRVYNYSGDIDPSIPAIPLQKVSTYRPGRKAAGFSAQ